jgi:hypothetical protein
MRIVLANLAWTCLPLGCASTIARSDYLGVEVGDIIESNKPLIVHECKKWESTASIWFSSPKSNRCVKSARAVRTFENVLMQLPAPSRFTVIEIKELGLVDSFEVPLYVELGATGQRSLIADLNCRGIFK